MKSSSTIPAVTVTCSSGFNYIGIKVSKTYFLNLIQLWLERLLLLCTVLLRHQIRSHCIATSMILHHLAQNVRLLILLGMILKIHPASTEHWMLILIHTKNLLMSFWYSFLTVLRATHIHTFRNIGSLSEFVNPNDPISVKIL